MSAVDDIASERQRQISGEGWTQEHDDGHKAGELAKAAACYALSMSNYSLIRKIWPWDWFWYKSRSARDDLVRAGALIVAEIERLDRAALASPSTHQRELTDTERRLIEKSLRDSGTPIETLGSTHQREGGE